MWLPGALSTTSLREALRRGLRPVPPSAPERGIDGQRANIAIMLPDMRGGGVERMRIKLARVWLRQGFEVDFVLFRESGELLPLVPPQARVHSLGTARYRKAIGPIVEYLKRERPTALLAAMWPLTVVAVVAARLAQTGTRVVVSDHNDLTHAYANRGHAHRWLLRSSIAAAYPLADGRVAVSRGVAEDLASLSGIAVERFTVIHNPAADEQRAVRASEPNGDRPVELAAHKRVVLSVGTLKAQKDHALLIDAFARLPAELNVQLCILGEGELRPVLEQQIHALGLEGKVVMPGFKMDTAPYYRAADLFVLSSRYEGFGNVIVEALEHGVPVVSTRCPSGPSEILDEGRFGRLVPVGDTAALARAIEESLLESHDRRALRQRAADFSPEAVASEYLRLLLPSVGAARAVRGDGVVT